MKINSANFERKANFNGASRIYEHFDEPEIISRINSLKRGGGNDTHTVATADESTSMTRVCASEAQRTKAERILREMHGIDGQRTINYSASKDD